MTERAPQADIPDRNYARLALGVPATLETLDARLKVEIVDISQASLMMSSDIDNTFRHKAIQFVQKPMFF